MIKQHFAALHRAGEPVILFNVWDAGSARAVAEADAKAIATGSFSVAGAQGFDDGEAMPFAVLLGIVSRIAKATSLPLTVDIETGYADGIAALRDNADALIEAGAAGCNLEDRLLASTDLRAVDEQCDRIAALDQAGLFVNARTDVFLAPLMRGEDPNRPELVDAALARASAYRAAGAGCLFVPGLSDPALIRQLCAAAQMPVNIMRLPGMVSNTELAQLGVARISYGPGPWRDAMAQVTEAARAAFAD